MASGFTYFNNLLQQGVDIIQQGVQNITSVVNKTIAYYPQNLISDKAAQWVIFHRRNSQSNRFEFGGSSPSGIGLYMPPNLRVSYGGDWSDIRMSVKETMEAFSAYQGMFKDPSSLSAKDKAFIDETSRHVMQGAANFIDTIGTNYGDQLQAETRRLPIMVQALLYKGPQLREFEMEFQLMAKNQGESESIQRIIQSFKEGMHPEKLTQHTRFWQYPDVFEVYFHCGNEQDKYMFKIDRCALVSMDVDYGGSGIPSFFENGAPVDIRMKLHFKELAILDRDKIKQGY